MKSVLTLGIYRKYLRFLFSFLYCLSPVVLVEHSFFLRSLHIKKHKPALVPADNSDRVLEI